MIRGKARWIGLLLVALFMASTFALTQMRADAGPASGETQYRLAAVNNSNGNVIHSVLLAQGVKTMADTTPVNGSKVCIPGDYSLFAAELTLTGTIGAGTAPVLTVVLQNSIDNGVTWSNVGSSFAAINSTVTPTGGKERVALADVPASTAFVWGDCWRVRYTWAGTAATTVANVGVQLIAK